MASKAAVRAFKSAPPDSTVKPPAFPPRPDLFDEVEWAPFVTPGDAKLAHRLWDLPNSILGNAIIIEGPFSRPDTEEEAAAQDMHTIANNVYEHLMQSHLRPPSEEDWEEKWRDTMLHDKTWSIQTIFAPIQELNRQGSGEAILVEGHNVLNAPWWTIARLREELRSRGLNDSGRSVELRKRLYDNELEGRGYSHLPRSDLSHWGLVRNDNFTFRLSETDVLKPLDMYTWAIMISPYNPAYWLSRAYCHYQQAFFDLAIGDAHRAQLLCEILVDPRERNRQPGLYPRIWHAIEQHLLAWPRNLQNGRLLPETERLRGPNGINYFVPTLRKALHNIISLSLSALSSWTDYYTMERYLKERVIMPYRDSSAFERRQRVLEDVVAEHQQHKGGERLFFYEKRAGNVNGSKEYPYEAKDKDRTGNVPLDVMNRSLFKDFPKCEVRANAEDNSLFVVATEDIEKDTLIFAEEPSIRGHLSMNRLPADKTWSEVQNPRCENCRKLVSRDVLKRYWEHEANDIKNGTHQEACKCDLQRGYAPMHFCPANRQQGTTCMHIARELYHYRACGKNWKWLHDAMRPGINDWKPSHKNPTDLKDPSYGRPGMSYFAHTNETHGTILSLLLREVFDITLMRRDRTGDANLMAHEIDELFMLEDPKTWSGSRFPFTLAGNIRVPFDILLQLGVDIFRDLTFDTWVIQTVLRKLLINVIPWDEKWRGKVEHVEQKKRPPNIHDQGVMLQQRTTFEAMDPSFQALYLFSGFSMFNHACRGRHNALWGYDETIPNRVLVWTTQDIPKSTEIRIPYKSKPISKVSAQRILGRHCQCSLCRDGDVDNGSSSEDEEEEEEDDDDDYEGYSDDGDDPDYDDKYIGNEGDVANEDDNEANDENAAPDNSTNNDFIPETTLPETTSIAQIKREALSSTQQPQPHELLSNPYVPAFAQAPTIPRQMAQKSGPRRSHNATCNPNPSFSFDVDSNATESTEKMSSGVFEEIQTQNQNQNQSQNRFFIRGLAEKRKRVKEEEEEEEEGGRRTPPGKKRKRRGSPHPTLGG